MFILTRPRRIAAPLLVALSLSATCLAAPAGPRTITADTIIVLPAAGPATGLVGAVRY